MTDDRPVAPSDDDKRPSQEDPSPSDQEEQVRASKSFFAEDFPAEELEPLTEKDRVELYEKYLKAGKVAYEMGRLDLAKTELMEGVAVFPDREEAADLLEEVDQKLRRETYEKLILQGEEFLDQGNLHGARAKFESALVIQSNKELETRVNQLRDQLVQQEFDNYRREGEAMFEAGAYKESIEYFERALGLKDDKATQERFQQAKDKLGEVSRVLWEAGRMAQEGRWADGLKHMEQGYEVYPDHPELLVTAAMFTSHREHYNQLWKLAKSNERSFRFYAAWQAYREILTYSPQDRAARGRMFWLIVKGTFLATTLLVAFGYTLWSRWGG